MTLLENTPRTGELRGARIGLITPRYAPAQGGVELHVQKVAEGLIQRGLDVEVITLDPTGQLPAYELYQGVPVRRFRVIQGGPLDLISPTALKWLTEQAGRYDLLHVHSYHTTLAAQVALVNRRWGKPLVVTPHYHATGHTALRKLLHRPYRLIGRWLMEQATAVLAVSQYEQGLLQRDFGKDLPVTVVPNGVEMKMSPLLRLPRPASGPKKLLSVGRLEGYKQTDRLVAALAELGDDYELTVVGVGPLRAQLAELQNRLGLQNRLRLAGAVSQDELARLYAESQLFISLSQHEAFGLTLLEAAVAGSKVLVSDIPAHREVAGYLPAGWVSFVKQDCTSRELAGCIERESLRETGPFVLPKSLPDWEKTTVAGVVDCYRQLLIDKTVSKRNR